MEEFFNRNSFGFEERERLVALSFSNFFKIGPRGIIKLLKRFGSLNKAYFATFGDLKNIGIREDIACAFLKFRQEFSLEETLNYLKTRQINFVYLEDYNYPKIFK
ncbi:hypothetical protein JXK06_03455, partial [Patescibacteria group bacterium]|nr:hypothetical protein [Patescibacteria group bacterium]